jgi:endonuclease YncB( thermonuclease family)
VSGAAVRLVAAVALAIILAAPAFARTRLPDFEPGGTVALGAVIDGQTLTLADGSTVRLAGIETPDAAMRGQGDLAARAKAALSKLVTGARLELRYAGAHSDRRGRIMAQLFANGRWVQRELLRRGLARVHGAADTRVGLRAMMAVEAKARAARRGLWRRAFFAVRRPEDAARVTGSFQLVEGTVADVATVAGGVYVNFGPDWHTAFALRIAGAALKLCRADGIVPAALKGARLRVRGFIDGTVRPLITVSFPEEIELVGPAGGTGAAAARD